MKYSVEGIVGFTTAPLILTTFIGLLFCLLALAGILFIIFRTLIFGDPTSGWPSMVCILLLISGVQLLCLGVVGLYLSNVYLEAKKRPLFIVRETEESSSPVGRDT